MRRLKVSAAALLLVLVAACGGGGAKSKGQPTDVSLSGDQIPAANLVAGLSQLCGVVPVAATNPVQAKTTYFDSKGPYATLHQLLAIAKGSEQKALQVSMQNFERDVLAPGGLPSAGADAAALYRAAKAVMVTLKIPPASCTNA